MKLHGSRIHAVLLHEVCDRARGRYTYTTDTIASEVFAFAGTPLTSAEAQLLFLARSLPGLLSSSSCSSSSLTPFVGIVLEAAVPCSAHLKEYGTQDCHLPAPCQSSRGAFLSQAPRRMQCQRSPNRLNDRTWDSSVQLPQSHCHGFCQNGFDACGEDDQSTACQARTWTRFTRCSASPRKS